MGIQMKTEKQPRQFVMEERWSIVNVDNGDTVCMPLVEETVLDKRFLEVGNRFAGEDILGFEEGVPGFGEGISEFEEGILELKEGTLGSGEGILGLKEGNLGLEEGTLEEEME